MIVNMYVDHLMSTPPASAEEVWNATRVHSKLFRDAAKRIGLNGSEYDEFRGALLDGKAVYVRLPRRVDAMSGNRRGSVYAVRNAVMTSNTMGWRVALSDGSVVYVPQVCGNISLLRPVHIAKAPAPLHYKPVAMKFHPAVAVVPKEQPVSMIAPEQETPVEIPQAPATVAQVVPVAASGGGGFLFLIPAALGGAVAAITHNNNNSTPPPPCSNGSNSLGVCTAR